MRDEPETTYTPSSAGFEHETLGGRLGPGAGRWFTEPCDEAGTALSFRVEAKLHEEHTPYQHIAIYQTTHFGRLMVIDGFAMLSTRDNFFYHEMLAHPAMFTHADPRRVVVIGGGDCGTLQQVLRHPGVVSAHQIDIDRRVTELAIEFFPELAECRHDPRARLSFEDGVAFMARAEPESIDVVIVDSTDPIGPAVGLYELPFLQSCRRALGPRGVLVQQSGSPFLHRDTELRPLMRVTREAGFRTVSPVCFPQPCYPSGWWSCVLASDLAEHGAFREQDAAARPFTTRYYNEAIHRAALATPPMLAVDD